MTGQKPPAIGLAESRLLENSSFYMQRVKGGEHVDQMDLSWLTSDLTLSVVVMVQTA